MEFHAFIKPREKVEIIFVRFEVLELLYEGVLQHLQGHQQKQLWRRQRVVQNVMQQQLLEI